MKRQKRIGQFGWLVMALFIGAFIWLYCGYGDQDRAFRIESHRSQTLATEEGKHMVLSLTLADGNNVKYLIKLPEADKLQAATKEVASTEKVSSWERERPGTASKHGDHALPLGVALKMSQFAVNPRLQREISGSQIRAEAPDRRLSVNSFSTRSTIIRQTQPAMMTLKQQGENKYVLCLGQKTPDNLIAMSLHGRSGVKRWVFGSVAEAVMRHCGDPVLITRPL